MDDFRLRQTFEKLSADELRKSLVRAGLYLAAFELLRYEVVDRTKSFLSVGGLSSRSSFAEEVAPLDRNEFDACAKWLVTVGAVDEPEAEELTQIRLHRNEIAHELPKLLVDPTAHLSPGLLERCRFYVDKISRFWVGVEVNINPDYDGIEVRPEDMKAGVSFLMDIVWEAANGPAA